MTDEPIEGARVVAADDTQVVVTDVALTDAQGNYRLQASATRDSSGIPVSIFTLRVSARDYLPYPHGIRPSLPVESSEAQSGEDGLVIDSPTTHVGLIPLDENDRGMGSISGTVTADGASGTLVVAEGQETPAPFGFADISGNYTIFNVPDGNYEVRGYQAGLQLETDAASMSGAQDLTGVNLAAISAGLFAISGQVNIVNAPGESVTSVVLVPESTFDDILERGQVPPGLRAPDHGVAPDISGAFEISGVPDGDYVVLAAFENDFLVRDPDPSIAGTQIVHVTIPDPDQGSPITLDSSFKITEALDVVSPGNDGPEAVNSTAPTFIFARDSSAIGYSLVVYDSFGVLTWENNDIPRVTGDHNVEVLYEGPDLVPGMYYQFRATSHRSEGPISMTEDLRGVFFLPAGG